MRESEADGERERERVKVNTPQKRKAILAKSAYIYATTQAAQETYWYHTGATGGGRQRGPRRGGFSTTVSYKYKH